MNRLGRVADVHFGVAILHDLVGVTAGAKHRNASHVALLLKKASASLGEWSSAPLQHDRIAEEWYRHRDAALRAIAVARCEAHGIAYTAYRDCVMGLSRLDTGDDRQPPVVMPWAHTSSSPTACNEGHLR